MNAIPAANAGAVGPELGVAGIVCGAPRLALAVGYDVEDVMT